MTRQDRYIVALGVCFGSVGPALDFLSLHKTGLSPGLSDVLGEVGWPLLSPVALLSLVLLLFHNSILFTFILTTLNVAGYILVCYFGSMLVAREPRKRGQLIAFYSGMGAAWHWAVNTLRGTDVSLNGFVIVIGFSALIAWASTRRFDRSGVC